MVARLRIADNTSFINSCYTTVNDNFHSALSLYIGERKKFTFSVLDMKSVEKTISRSDTVFERSAGGNYMLFHKPTKSVYFGETNNLAARALEHMTAIYCKSHSNRGIRRRSRGKMEDWIFSVLCYEQSEFNRKNFERAFINRKWEWTVLNVK